MYTQSVKLDDQNVQEILGALHMLQAHNLFDLCCKYIEEHICPQNCLGIWLLGRKYDVDQMAEKGFEMALKSFSDAKHTDDFINLELADLLEYIKQLDKLKEELDTMRKEVVSNKASTCTNTHRDNVQCSIIKEPNP